MKLIDLPIWDVKYRGKDIGYLYVAEDGFLRYRKVRHKLPILTPDEARAYERVWAKAS